MVMNSQHPLCSLVGSSRANDPPRPNQTEAQKAWRKLWDRMDRHNPRASLEAIQQAERLLFPEQILQSPTEAPS